ncbi:hypothetical protein MJ3_00900 [Salimicrobium jeotgali]|uniref:Uncharacterized protein n=2 Tax=Salimicrobium TaxID=351195 RepID=K2GRI8_9BACI|nr:hypothetical protein [Salimicrobium jeotgali]EKE33014.1 hypothetical protein MJ3_00900 [Salimicrobium jeotgali]
MGLTYTSEMEKGMFQAHDICFAEYGRKLETQIHVEKKRSREYEESKKIHSEMERQLHR